MSLVRLITSLVLILFLIGLFYIENNGIFLMIVALSFLSFSEIYNLRKSKVMFQYLIPIFTLLYFFFTKSGILNSFEHYLLIIFYSLSSLFIIICLFKKSNIHFSLVGFLINSTFFR